MTTNFQNVKVIIGFHEKGGDNVAKSNLDLRGRIIQKFGTQGNFAKHLGKTEQTVTAKLSGRSQFSQNDIIDWSNALDLDADDVGKYFFAQTLSKNES